jgi:hypothetical protein
MSDNDLEYHSSNAANHRSSMLRSGGLCIMY